MRALSTLKRLTAPLLLALALAPLLASAPALDAALPDFFARASVPEAFGRNVVNVILVDFRATDTFGEIVVVVIAAIAAYALLRVMGCDLVQGFHLAHPLPVDRLDVPRAPVPA